MSQVPKATAVHASCSKPLRPASQPTDASITSVAASRPISIPARSLGRVGSGIGKSAPGWMPSARWR